MSKREKVLSKVRALLDQAESTDYEPEAHAFLAKAEHLMVKYDIEEALVLASGKPIEDKIGFRRFYVDAGKYEGPRIELIFSVAQAHGLDNAVMSGRKESSPEMRDWYNTARDDRGPRPKREYVKWVEVCGFESDLDYLDMLVTSLSLQAAEAVHSPQEVATMRSETSAPGHVIAWKNAFLKGFTGKVASRIRSARKEAEREAKQAFAAEQAEADEPVSTSVAVALRDKDQAVKSEFVSKYPKLWAGKASTAGSCGGSGYSSGRDAGSRARIGGTAIKGNKGALAR